MIFVTVGTQLPFDRLIGVIDAWAARNTDVDVFAQIGPGAAAPKAMQFVEFVPPSKADEMMRTAELIVAHAGMGSILTALKYQRPILILPRKAALGEHRNDHQMATAKWLGSRPGITVAWEASELPGLLDQRDRLATGERLHEFANGPLVEKLSAFIAGCR